MRTDGADRVPRAAPPRGSGTRDSTRAARARDTAAGRPLHLDGRVARGEETRRLLVDALVTLVDGGAIAPTNREVADRAGVSVRLVFHHFLGTQGLLVAAVAHQSERHRSILFSVPPRGPLDLRVRALCRQRRLYFEAVAPMIRLALARADAAALQGLLADERARLRHQLAGTLAPEVAARGVEAEALLDALEHATGWESWRALRDVRGHTPAGAERAMAFTTGHLLD